MPELPDIVVYIEALERRILDRRLRAVRLASPFVLRSVLPPISAVEGRRAIRLGRIGKRIVIGLEDDFHLVLHLMVAGRLQWREREAKPPGRSGLAAFDFESGTLILTEASSRKRAALHVVAGSAGLEAFHRGGVEPLEADESSFAHAIRRENHTVKRALTDPRLVSGIGNAYSDEILHRARLSPLIWTARLADDQVGRLHRATVEVLMDWTDRLRREVGGGFPSKVTAFREGMAVHGRFGRPCPVCDTVVQRIVFAENTCNYCPRCQTEGKLLADRALSRLLRGDWPRTIEAWEEGRGAEGRGAS